MINPRPLMILMLLCISLIILLQGCAAPGFIAGSTASTATASGSYQTFKTVSLMKAGVDTALAADGKKTTTDHVVSSLTGKDCKAMRVIEEEALEVYCLSTKPDFLSDMRGRD
tara:strand:- start:456 stop:794 length:339 start_codon:yes stop_codon:yes gene_type:complete